MFGTKKTNLDIWLENPEKQELIAKMPYHKPAENLDEWSKDINYRSQVHCWLMNNDPEYLAIVESRAF